MKKPAPVTFVRLRTEVLIQARFTGFGVLHI